MHVLLNPDESVIPLPPLVNDNQRLRRTEGSLWKSGSRDWTFLAYGHLYYVRILLWRDGMHRHAGSDTRI